MTAREAWAQAQLPAVVVPAAIGTELAAELRERFATRYTHYGQIDQASYDYVDAPPLGEITDILAGVASEVTGRPLKLETSRLLRLRPGDYILVRHDRLHDERPVELILDLSAAAVPDAEVHWRHRGQVFFTMPSTPSALALVERGPTVLANHTYLSKRGTIDVVRLHAILRVA